MRFAGQSETQHLQDHGNRFENEDAAHDREQQFLFATDRDDSDHSADRERSGVAHDDFRRMAVEPEKPQAGSDQRRADHGQLAGERIKRDLQDIPRSENCRQRRRARRRRKRP